MQFALMKLSNDGFLPKSTRSKYSAPPASDYNGRVVKTVSPKKTPRNRWAGDTSLVGVGEGLNPTRNQIFLSTFDLA